MFGRKRCLARSAAEDHRGQQQHGDGGDGAEQRRDQRCGDNARYGQEQQHADRPASRRCSPGHRWTLSQTWNQRCMYLDRLTV